MSEIKPVYLIWGDDQAKLDRWRERVRARAAGEGPTTALEVLKDEAATAEAAVEAISSLTLTVGRRYVLVDGAERWRDRDIKAVVAALGELPPETVMVLIGSPVRGKPKLPATLAKAVKKAGGEVHTYEAPKAAAYPGWAAERARELGFELDREAAAVLVERIPVDEKSSRLRQQTLMRELEKLSIYAAGGRVTAAEVDDLTASAVDVRVYELGDAVIEQDAERALRLAEELRARDVQMMHILFALLRKLTDCRRAQMLIAEGMSSEQIQDEIRGNPWAVKHIIAQARRADADQVERAIELLAELDYEVRGGGHLDEESALTSMLARATA